MIENIERGRIVSELLLKKYKDPGIFGHKEMPDFEAPKELKRGSRDHLFFLTLLSAMTSMRDFVGLYKATKETWEDKETRFLFYPKELLKRTDSEVFEAITEHGVAKRKYREVFSYLVPFSKALVYFFDGDPYNLLKACEFDALKIYEKMRTTLSERLPYISGKKILPMYLRMISQHEFPFELKNLEKIPIPVDVHISRATVILGCISGEFQGLQEDFYLEVQRYWTKVCAHSELKPLDLDGSLWTLSKYGCRVRREDSCPRESLCYFSRLCKPGKYEVSLNEIYISM